jgi:hypothetical protein
MINVTLNDRVFKIRNNYDEITVGEYDELLHLMVTEEEEIPLRKLILEKLSDIPMEIIEEIPLGIFEQITEYILVEDYTTYPRKNYKLHKMTGKVMRDVEKIVTSDEKYKTTLMLSIILDEDRSITGIRGSLVSDFIHLIKEFKLFNPSNN